MARRLVNEAIWADEVLLVDEDGADLGPVARAEALALARTRGRAPGPGPRRARPGPGRRRFRRPGAPRLPRWLR